MNGTKKIKYSRTDQIILGIAYVFLGVFVLSILIPLIYVVLASFMDPTVLNNQGLSFHIKDWTLDAYRGVMFIAHHFFGDHLRLMFWQHSGLNK